MEDKADIVRWLMCGAAAGLTVDLSLYPLDTIKTRLQSQQGFRAAGGFKNLYRGMGSVAMGSAPGAALFFVTYSYVKQVLKCDSPLCDAFRASCGEIAACLVRVPTEIIKQRSQTSASSRSVISRAAALYRSNGLGGFYKGYWSTVSREVPFSFIEFPLWEYLKRTVAKKTGQSQATPLQSAACGSVAGSVAAAVTTPLDVAKTRIMLDRATTYTSVPSVLLKVAKDEGFTKLYAGVLPRSIWMGIGGYVFFFAYEFSLKMSHTAF